MHAIGIDHEQNRPDRNNYIVLHEENMQINKKHNFDILTQFEWMDTGHNYEYRSVMHYDAFDFAISKVRVAKISVFWLR